GRGGSVYARTRRAYDVQFTVIARRFMPPVSKRIVICWTPPPSVTGTDTVVQFCQPPVAGIETVFHTLLALLNPRCIDAPPGEARRGCRGRFPAAVTFPV